LSTASLAVDAQTPAEQLMFSVWAVEIVTAACEPVVHAMHAAKTPIAGDAIRDENQAIFRFPKVAIPSSYHMQTRAKSPDFLPAGER
jgi:hypothetical protein